LNKNFVFVGSDVWTEDWGWNEDEQMEEDDSESGESTGDERNHNWLQDCLTSISPANDLMAVAYGDKLVLLSRKFYKDFMTIVVVSTLCWGCRDRIVVGFTSTYAISAYHH